MNAVQSRTTSPSSKPVHRLVAVVIALGLTNLGTTQARAAAPEVQEPAPEADAETAPDGGAPAEPGGEAQPPQQEGPTAEELAVEAFQSGRDAYASGNYQVALEHFQDAQGLHPSPDFHYNIGQCYESLEKYEQAVTSYRAYLRSDPGDRANIEKKIERLERRLEEQRQAEEEQRKQSPTTAGPMAKDNSKALIISGSVLTAVGAGAAAGLGAAFGSQAKSNSEAVDDVANGNPDGLTLEETRALDEDGRKAEVIQLVGIGVGGAVALTGIALLAIGLAKKKKAGAGKEESTQASITPTFGPRGAGFALTGRF